MGTSIVVTLEDKEYNVARSTLRQWLELEETVKKIKEGKSKDKAQAIYSYLSIVLGGDIDFNNIAWHEVVNAFGDVIFLNSTKYDFPILKAKIKEVTVSWDYEGRTFYIWAHTLKGYDSQAIAKFLLKEADIVVTPGVGFGECGEGYIRMALTVDKEKLAEAVERIRKAI